MKAVICMVGLILMLSLCSAKADVDVCVTVRVEKAASQPISSADVMIRMGRTGSETGVVFYGKTDSNGQWVLQSQGKDMILVNAEADGYYGTFGGGPLFESGPWGTNIVVRLSSVEVGTVQVVVTDEGGQPIANADVELRFEQNFRPTDIRKVVGVTDYNGSFSAASSTSGDIAGGVTMQSYYATRFQRTFQEGEPWDATIPVVLRRVKNPIAMYAKPVSTKIPSTNEWCGYDLLAGDWVSPYGRGQTGDFLFRQDGTWQSYDHHDMTVQVAFANSGDGLIPVPLPTYGGSVLHLPNEAPETGYETNRMWRTMRHHYGRGSETPTVFQDDHRADMNYFFRVRSVINQQGEVTNALYGKVYGDLDQLQFIYYLNPYGTRNVELNTSSNLFATPGGRGQVSAP